MGGPQGKPKPPAMILVPEPFDFPPAAARTRMAVPAYDLMFGKLSLRRLFDDYYPRQPGMNVDAGVLFRPPPRDSDSHVDITATMSKNGGEALLRWQRDLDDPNTFVDLFASSSKSMLKLSSCAYYPKYGIGAFGTSLCLWQTAPNEVPYGAWLVGRKGRFSAGVQYKPLLGGSKHPMPYTDLKNWNCAISYGMGSTSPLSNSLICTLELIRSTQLVASVYEYRILQWREKYRLGDDLTGVLNYIDYGLELAIRVDKDKPADSADKSLFQLATSCQLNSYLLVKAEIDRSKGISYGLGIRVGEFMEHSYQTVDSDWKVLTETEEYFDGEKKKRTFQFNYDAGEFDNLPTGMKPIDKIL